LKLKVFTEGSADIRPHLS